MGTITASQQGGFHISPLIALIDRFKLPFGHVKQCKPNYTPTTICCLSTIILNKRRLETNPAISPCIVPPNTHPFTPAPFTKAPTIPTSGLYFMRNTIIPIVTFLAPSFWMNLPSRVIHKPRIDLSGSYGSTLCCLDQITRKKLQLCLNKYVSLQASPNDTVPFWSFYTVPFRPTLACWYYTM
jgi:hypothetical protein